MAKQPRIYDAGGYYLQYRILIGSECQLWHWSIGWGEDEWNFPVKRLGSTGTGTWHWDLLPHYASFRCRVSSNCLITTLAMDHVNNFSSCKRVLPRTWPWTVVPEKNICQPWNSIPKKGMDNRCPKFCWENQGTMMSLGNCLILKA